MKHAFTYLLLLTIAIIVSFPALAAAHATLDHAEPHVGSEVGKPPVCVKIWFTQEVEPSFSKIVVFDSNGKQVDQKDCHCEANDRKQLMVSLAALTPGTYKVSWRVISADTHRTQGDFRFVVKP